MEWWVIAGTVWGTSSVLFVASERTAFRHWDVWDPRQPWVSVGVYSILLLFSPALVGLGMAVAPLGAFFALRRRLRRFQPVDPLAAPIEKWPAEQDSFLVQLVQRRVVYDPRLKGLEVDEWPMYVHWEMPESAVLLCVHAYRDLTAAGLPEAEVWKRLDEFGLGGWTRA